MSHAVFGFHSRDVQINTVGLSWTENLSTAQNLLRVNLKKKKRLSVFISPLSTDDEFLQNVSKILICSICFHTKMDSNMCTGVVVVAQ